MRELRARSRSERGTVVVESAIALPVFLLIVFGTIEFGLAFRSYLTTTAAARDSARYAATMGKDVNADFFIISDALNSLGPIGGSEAVTTISIFRATGPDSTTASGALAACRTGSVAGLCNTYRGPDLTTDPYRFACRPTAADRFWCPTSRKVNLSDPPDYVGIYIEVEHEGLTGVLGSSMTFTEEVVTRLEPVRK
ncbi:MAG: pilus assembly protein [Actinobacteria bacterium]|nr:pilus assembly protein [Actinomycetota bacterium]